ncbi:dephospho-CoA kinase [Cesiribacter sp. SM1]|uniref:dephospho-CoA kinase n=1 Tax=Cesiribacter sp. SM1 TaxID=2861196 RepID=UPI001CD5F126|nr:dephospho-CoA kinase [Cesiribacter sp. SM1]
MTSQKHDKTADNKPLKIGITGGIGAGKSTVCKIFAALGIPVYDADSRAKRLLVEDSELMEQIRAAFGGEAYFPEGGLNRVWLAAQVFSKPDQLAQLNKLVHPRVGLDFESWYQQQEAPYVLKEAALLFEAGSYKSLDAVITVTAPQPLRLRRTLMRDEHRSREQVEDIMQRQLPEEERIQRSQFKIVNDEHSLVLPQVLRLHRQLLRRELPAAG